MSDWLDKSDALATYLGTLTALAGIDIVVDRQLDISSHIAAAKAKRAGVLISILWTGGRNPDRKAARLRMGGRYSVFIITRPRIRAGETPADDIVETVATALHGWCQDPGPNNLTRRLEVIDVAIVPDAALLIHEITCEALRV
jgi:hypothetical protein